MACSSRWKTDACELLIESGADLSARTWAHRTALCAAVEKHHLDTVALILPHCKAGTEFESLEAAIALGFQDIANVLLDSGRFKHHNLSNVYRTSSSLKEFPDWERHWAKNWYAPNWEQFLVNRRHRLDDMDPTYLECALVAAHVPD